MKIIFRKSYALCSDKFFDLRIDLFCYFIDDVNVGTFFF